MRKEPRVALVCSRASAWRPEAQKFHRPSSMPPSSTAEGPELGVLLQTSPSCTGVRVLAGPHLTGEERLPVMEGVLQCTVLGSPQLCTPCIAAQPDGLVWIAAREAWRPGSGSVGPDRCNGQAVQFNSIQFYIQQPPLVAMTGACIFANQPASVIQY